MTLCATRATVIHLFLKPLFLVGLLFAIAATFDGTTPASAQSLKSASTWCQNTYENYWKKRKRDGFAAFAVARDGYCGYSNSYETAARARSRALSECGRSTCKIVMEIAPTVQKPANKNKKLKSAALAKNKLATPKREVAAKRKAKAADISKQAALVEKSPVQSIPSQSNPYETKPIETVCGDALDHARVAWRTDMPDAAEEIRRRGETIESCRLKLQLPPRLVETYAAVEEPEPSYVITDANEDLTSAAPRGIMEKRIALVIGNSTYALEALPNSTNDARAIAESLVSMGFEVIAGENLDQAEMQKKVVEFEDRAREANVALFYYAGHAVQLEGRNYLIPVDVTVTGETALRFESVELDLVAATMTDGGASGIILLDACRDNPFRNKVSASRVLAVGDGLAAPSFVSGGILYGFATTPGEVALDGKGAHSPFTAALLKHLSGKGIEIEQILKDVSIDVAEATGGKQIPWRNTNLRKKVYLNP